MVIEVLYGILVKFLHNNKYFCWSSHKNNKELDQLMDGLDCTLNAKKSIKMNLFVTNQRVKNIRHKWWFPQHSK